MSVHASDELARLDAVGLAAAIARGDVSAREATEAAIGRAEALNPELNALVVTDFERALAHASAPGGGVLAGVPTVVKDNEDVFGLPTRYGSRATPSRDAAADSPFVTEYRSTGVVVIGKSTLPAFGFNASTEFDGAPPTRNPWHLGFSCGASSGGSAALVAAGVVPIAHANDGGGSIRIPAAACGLVGLKASRGRIVDPAEADRLPVNILCNGVVTRTVRDTATFVAAAEAYKPAPGLPMIGQVEGPADRRLRIGLLIDSVTGVATDDETRAAVRETALLLEKLGHEVVEVQSPVGPKFIADFTHYWALLGFSMRRFGRRMYGPEYDPTQLDPLTLYLARRFMRHAWRTPSAISGLRKTAAQYEKSFESSGVDAVLSPTLATTTPRLGYLSPEVEFPEMFDRVIRYASFTPLHNATGAPGISLPAGLTAEGLPIGIHLSARVGHDRTLLELAYELEAARPFPSLL
ncbi:MAG TPA: amidase [Aeromicrobium sp.]|nr:amidase [Aeromicrobium sp.]